MKKEKKAPPISDLLKIMAKLRSPEGCPWDREQDHKSLRFHSVEEAYELMDAIEAESDEEMIEELGDVLLQVVFHAQLARERKAFDFDTIARSISEKLVRRHPHVFGESEAETVEAVWKQWEQIKKAEKKGTSQERHSALDGIPRHLPSLLRTEKLVKKARKAGLLPAAKKAGKSPKLTREAMAKRLFRLAAEAQAQGFSAEELLREHTNAVEKKLRVVEAKKSGAGATAPRDRKADNGSK